MKPAAAPRGLLAGLALLYTLFVVYGSLVPLEFHRLPLAEAVARFRAIPFLELGIGSRADWVANLLLFVPLTFLWMAVVCAGRGRGAPALAVAVIVPVAVALSGAIEFTQLFFPQRTVSQNDLFAESLGGGLGVVLWLAAGDPFVDWLAAWRGGQVRAPLADRLAWGYLACVVAYNLLPLDLTLSAVEIFHKWQEGRVRLTPFAGLPPPGAELVYQLGVDLATWAVLAGLLRHAGRRSAPKAWALTFAAAAALEFLQLFVWSRVSDVTDLITAALGAAAGVLIAGRGGRGADRSSPADPRAWLLAGGVLLYSALLALAFWYPYAFRMDGEFLRARLDLFLGRVPFEAYYFGTEYRAATEVLHKLLFFAPLGGLLAAWVAALPWRWRGGARAFSCVWVAGLAGVLTVGRLALPDKSPDSADLLLQAAGAVSGYAFAARLMGRRTTVRVSGRGLAAGRGNNA